MKTKHACSHWVKKTDDHGLVQTEPQALNTWHHLVLVLQPDNTEFAVFHNGEKVGSTDMETYQDRNSGSGNVIIGNKFDDDESPWWSIGSSDATGAPIFFESITVDELAMWNQALSDDQVDDIYEMLKSN